MLAVAAENHTFHATGPLSDGVFTLDELKEVLFRTPSPIPQEDRASGDVWPERQRPPHALAVEHGP